MSGKTLAIIAIRAAERRKGPIGEHVGGGVWLYRGIEYAIGHDGQWKIQIRKRARR